MPHPPPDFATIGARPPRLPGLRLLIAEDSPDAAEALKVLLQFEGADVHMAHDGLVALQLLETHAIDLVVSDLAMPSLDGYGFIAAVRADPRFATLPCIALTGFGRDTDVQRALQAGFQAHVTKPVDLDDLVARIVQVRGKI